MLGVDFLVGPKKFTKLKSADELADSIQRKTKGQQLKGKIVSEVFTLFHNFSHFFINFPPGLPLQNKGF